MSNLRANISVMIRIFEANAEDARKRGDRETGAVARSWYELMRLNQFATWEHKQRLNAIECPPLEVPT